jgi:hypothetical protein
MNSSKPTKDTISGQTGSEYPPRYVDRHTACKLYCVSIKILRAWEKRGLRHSRVNGKVVLYSPAEIDLFLQRYSRKSVPKKNKKQSQVPPSGESSVTADSKISRNGELSSEF